MHLPHRDASLAALDRVAVALPQLAVPCVFVGGAVVPLLLTDPAAPDVRETTDVDAVVGADTRVGFEVVQERLRAARWSPDTSPGAPLCRWRTPGGDIVDVMPPVPDVLGFANRWYPLALAHAVEHVLPSGTRVRVISSPLFILTKLEAFEQRGRGDVFASHDLEDIIAVFDARPGLDEEMEALPPEARALSALTGRC